MRTTPDVLLSRAYWLYQPHGGVRGLTTGPSHTSDPSETTFRLAVWRVLFVSNSSMLSLEEVQSSRKTAIQRRMNVTTGDGSCSCGQCGLVTSTNLPKDLRFRQLGCGPFRGIKLMTTFTGRSLIRITQSALWTVFHFSSAHRESFKPILPK
jgi:hypothetical protein